MINRQLAIGLVIGIALTLIGVAIFHSLQPEPKNQSDPILIKSLEQRDEKIKIYESGKKEDLRKLDSLQKEYLILVDKKQKTIYVKEYISVDRANIVGKDSILRANLFNVSK